MSPIERLIKQLRGELDKIDAQNLTNLARAFDRSVYKALLGDIDALTKLLEAEKRGVNVRNTTEFKRLMGDIEDRLNSWQNYMRTSIPVVASASIQMGVDSAAALVDTYRLSSVFRKSNPAVIERLLKYLDENGPLFKRIESMAGYYVDVVREAILAGVGRGDNPRDIAALITRNLGMALTDSLRTTRTVQLWSYRDANRASYIENSDVVSGWIWYAELDSETCMSCVVQHGTVHGLDETLDDHYNGRCSMVPVVIGQNPGIQTGQDWFGELTESEQRNLMGDGRYEAWKEDKFTLDALSRQHDDDVYGSMRTEASLKELIGE